MPRQTLRHARRSQLPMRRLAMILPSVFLGLATTPAFSQTAVSLEGVEILEPLPLPSIGQAREHVAGNVQVIQAGSIQDHGATNLSELMQRQLGSVHINDLQGNPYQTDLSFRGYTASPLLGTPQGISVYLDGVRMNQPFGETVSWDLIPQTAIRSVSLMPGSNPLFGLNTLGGAIALQTKSGLSDAGSRAELKLGGHDRVALNLEHGGYNERGLHWYLNGASFRENGWRDASPSRVDQAFGKLGWSNASTDLQLSLASANTSLTGNGLQEQRLLSQSYNSVYTTPDETHNRSLLLNLQAKHSLSEHTVITAQAYARRITTRTLYGDLNENALDQSVYQPNAAEQSALTAAGYRGFPSSGANASNTPFPMWRCLANTLLNDEPGEKCNALLNRSQSQQRNHGFALQLVSNQSLAGLKNRFSLGFAYDRSRSTYQQTSQYGYLNPDRSVTAVDAYADGSRLDDAGNPVDARVDLHGTTETTSVYASDTLSVRPDVFLSLSGRYNQQRIQNRDQITPGGGSGSLDGDHRFRRYNPALGLSYVPNQRWNAYISYSEASRSPSVIELGCADPANPCRLPNAMAGDPPLKQVVTQTLEVGLRGLTTEGLNWSLSAFHAENHDDIQFVADDAVGYGYFKNFGKTVRQGLELGLQQRLKDWRWQLNYTYLDAHYASPETVNGEANSSSDADGRIQIRPGDRMPLIPRHLLKARLDWQALPKLKLNLGLNAVSSMLARGNENAQHQADGTQFVGEGRTKAYAIFDLGANYQSSKNLSFFLSINNLFNQRYHTGAQLGATGLTPSGQFIARPFSAQGDNTTLVHSTFLAPGAPRSFMVGTSVKF